MTSLADIRQGLAANLQALPGVEVYEREGGMVNVPCAVVLTPTIDYHQSFSSAGLVRYEFRVMVLVQSSDSDQSGVDLDTYADPTSPTSVRAAVESDRTLGGIADDLICTAFRPLSSEEVAGIGYWGGDFAVTVYTRP